MWRNKMALASRFISVFIANMVFGGEALLHSPSADVVGNYWVFYTTATQLAITIMLSAVMPVLLDLPTEWPRFTREHQAGTYSTGAFFLHKLAIEAVVALLTAVIAVNSVYTIQKLTGPILSLVAVAWLLSLASASAATLLAILVRDLRAVFVISPIIFWPQIVFDST